MEKKKAIFLDRDGTLIVEPPDTHQVDSLDKLEFLPGVFRNLHLIASRLEHELVMVTNQDGLGKAAYPEETFRLVQSKMVKAFKNEGVCFKDVLVDRSVASENKPTRKPGTGLLTGYMKGDYDLGGSFVIGDRLTDIELARNLGAMGILIGEPSRKEEVERSGLEDHCVMIAQSWDDIASFLVFPPREATLSRQTEETDIFARLNLDGTGRGDISTGLGFLDHMLEQIPVHSGCDLTLKAKGDLHRDEHHTIEDAAIVLGEVFRKALGEGGGTERYGFVLPMDEALCTAALDFGGRAWLEWDAGFKREKIGDVPTEMFPHFFRSFCQHARCNLHIEAKGENEHHKAESIFKCFARAIKLAVKRDNLQKRLPTTKGRF